MIGARTLVLAALTIVGAASGCGGTSDSQSGTDSTTAGAKTPTVTEPTTTSPQTPKPKPTMITIRVVGGLPLGGIARPSVKKNARVVIVVRSDTADEVHLHGYDISRPVAAGSRARLSFVAEIPGRFEVELEERGVQIAELTVR